MNGTKREWEETRPGWPATLGAVKVAAGVVEVRPVRARDAFVWSRLRLRDQAYLEQWETSAPGSWSERNTSWSWISQWLVLRSLARRGQCLPFAIVVNGEFAGQLTVGNVIRGSLRSAWLGYWVSSTLAGGGVATAAVGLAVDHLFEAGGLHRIEATVRPENVASLRVLNKTGFRQEGLFRRYLEVAGAWRDHFCFALTAEEIGEGLVARLIAEGRMERS